MTIDCGNNILMCYYNIPIELSFKWKDVLYGGNVWQIPSSKVVGECLQQHCVVCCYYYVIITCTVYVRDCVCNHEAGTRMCSFVIDSVIHGSMAQTFSFTAAIVDDGNTLLNGPFAS